MAHLTELDLTGNDIRDLPDSISQLTQLQILKLNRNTLKNLPRNHESLGPTLRELHLQVNELTSWPSSLNKFQCLEKLDLSFNQLNKISMTTSSYSSSLLSLGWFTGGTPTSILPIQQSLKVLDLAFNRFESFPAKLLEFPQLESLRLSGNDICVIPDTIGRLRDTLTHLHVNKCRLTEFPATITTLTNLRVLNISENPISKFPDQEQLRHLNKLEELYAHDCNILQWSQLGVLNQLRILHLSKNQIEGVPTEVKSLRNMRELKLNHNRIAHVPEHMTRMSMLERLDLSHNVIEDIDEEICQFTRLRALNLCNNSIEYLPATMKMLRQLETLDISCNRIDEMFDWSLMQRLVDIKASNNMIKAFPTGIERNPYIQSTLTTIDFTMNQIVNLPKSFYLLKALRCARLKHNHIMELDEDIALMQNLMQLNLDNNEITNIPVSITKLTQLNALNLSFNYQQLQIPEQVEQWARENNVFISSEFEAASPVIKGVFIGGANAATNRHLLKSYGVTHVLTVAKDITPKYVNDFKYMVILADDIQKASLKEHFNDTTNFIKEALESNGGCIVHCMAGVSRSATIMTAFIMQHQQIRLRHAFRFLGKCRPQVNPNQTFRSELQQFDKELFEGVPAVTKQKNEYVIYDPVSKSKTTYYPDGRTGRESLIRLPPRRYSIAIGFRRSANIPTTMDTSVVHDNIKQQETELEFEQTDHPRLDQN